MPAHRIRIHLTCLYCSSIFEKTPSDARKGNKYCSSACAGKARQKRVIACCTYCGKYFTTQECWINRENRESKNGTFCSKQCIDSFRSTKELVYCKQCNTPFKVKRNEIKRGGGKYCSTECSFKAHRGNGSVFWAGGKIYYYGSNWHSQRELAHARDGGICQICHKKPKKCEKQFAVHHIIKRRNFSKDDPEANALTNLITLCTKCHSKADRSNLPVPVPLL